MSLQGWKDRFYPTSAVENISTPLEAAEHSLQKWSGLEHLEEYGLLRVRRIILDHKHARESFMFNDMTCSLCRYSVRNTTKGEDDYCKACPLSKFLGEKASSVPHNHCVSEYDAFLDGKFEPMINVLSELVKVLWKEEDEKVEAEEGAVFYNRPE